MTSVTHTSAPVVRVRINKLGGWQVSVPDDHGPRSCENLDEARRLAHECAADGRARERIVYDPYHRVLERELIDERAEGPPA
jgi:hypothetical protein